MTLHFYPYRPALLLLFSSFFPSNLVPLYFFSFISPYLLTQIFYLCEKHELPMTALAHSSLCLSILLLFIDLLLSSPSECNLSSSQPSHKVSQIGQITVKQQNGNYFTLLRLWQRLDVTYWTLDSYPDSLHSHYWLSPELTLGNLIH